MTSNNNLNQLSKVLSLNLNEKDCPNLGEHLDKIANYIKELKLFQNSPHYKQDNRPVLIEPISIPLSNVFRQDIASPTAKEDWKSLMASIPETLPCNQGVHIVVPHVLNES